MRTLRVLGGDEIRETLKKAYLLSMATGEKVSFTFSGIVYVADAEHQTFTTPATPTTTDTWAGVGIKLIPTFTDPVIDALREREKHLQEQLRSVHIQIADRIEQLAGKVST